MLTDRPDSPCDAEEGPQLDIGALAQTVGRPGFRNGPLPRSVDLLLRGSPRRGTSELDCRESYNPLMSRRPGVPLSQVVRAAPICNVSHSASTLGR